MKYVSVSEAISQIKSQQRVFVHGGAATPLFFLEELVRQAPRFLNVELIHMHTMGSGNYAASELNSHFRVANLFVGENIRKHFNYCEVDYIPCFLSEIPNLFRSKRRPLDVALIHVSPPDNNGFCSLGTSVDIAKAATDVAPLIIAQINPQMPRVHGDGFIHESQIHYAVDHEVALPESKPTLLSDTDRAIGRHVAGIVKDGSTLQMGIGAVPDACLDALKSHKRLGIHTEMWSDGALALIKSGAVTNSRKKVHPGKTVSGFIIGSKEVYDFINDNPSVVQLDIAYVNHPNIIARNPRVVAINSAIEIDLTGQVCADSIGHRIISGVGGQMDFMRGAALSEDGKPIIALTSRSKNSQPRIVSTLKPGAGVVTTRSHIHYVVTEYGIADLYGATLCERAKRLIEIAHPDDRERLDRERSEYVRGV